ncbi:peptidase M23 [Bacteroidia bacterium]|nr:peptidase M23 [Bacteroidia bacterium]
MAKEQKAYIKRLKSKYRFIICNDQTYAEVWHMRLSRLNVMSFVGVVGIVLIAGVVALIAFTPLRQFIPGYPDRKMHEQIIRNALRLDSLQQQVQYWELYNDNIHRILSGKEPISIENQSDTALATRYRSIMFAKSRVDSLFRLQVEKLDLTESLPSPTTNNVQEVRDIHFSAPMVGELSRVFAPQDDFFGIEILSPKAKTPIVAVLDGTVIALDKTEKGLTIVIQHDYNLTTVYKQVGMGVKKVNAAVKAGEIIGYNQPSSKSMPTPPSMIFEIWNNRVPVNPALYVTF